MDYAESLEWLYGTQVHGIHLGLDTVRRLLLACGVDPERPVGEGLIFHVAGTNGKGSVCSLLDAGLRGRGLRTGLYTSPHLVRFRERIRVDGEEIGEEAVAEGLTILRECSARLGVEPTFFELATVLALRHFARARVDALVLETGMGGRLDATNVVRSDASVVTRIGMDHMAFLGGTLGAIAGEKAGIFKRGVPGFTSEQDEEAMRVLGEVARGEAVDLEVVESHSYPEEWALGLIGRHQRANAALALRALSVVLGEDVSAFRVAFEGARWPGRFDEVATGLILDGAHNPDAARVLGEAWIERFGPRSAVAYIGMMSDKDVEGVLEGLAPALREVVVVTALGPRAIGEEELARRAAGSFRRRGVPVRIGRRGDGALWSEMSRRSAGGERLLVTGSLYWVGEVMGWHRGLGVERSAQ